MYIDLQHVVNSAEGAQLVTQDGAITLLLLSHEHPDKCSVERYRLGPLVELPVLIKLLDTLGLLPRSEPVTTATPDVPGNTVPKSEMAAPVSGLKRPTCPECGYSSRTAAGVAIHRRKKHGVVSEQNPLSHTPASEDPPEPPRTPNPRTCDLCGKPWKGHLRCEECSALIGRGHPCEQPITINGKPYCMKCGARRALKRSTKVAA